MNIRTQIIVVAVTLIAIFLIVNKVRRKEIELKYSLLWILLGAGVILFACIPQLTSWLAGLMGIGQPINMLFFIGFCFAILIIFSLSVAISKLSTKVKKMAQEIALLEEKMKEIEVKNKSYARKD